MKTPPFLKDFIDLFFPRLCPVCQRALNRNEENICTTCLHRLPRTGYHLDPLSPMAQLFLGKVPIEKCAAFFFFLLIVHSPRFDAHPPVIGLLPQDEKLERITDKIKDAGILNADREKCISRREHDWQDEAKLCKGEDRNKAPNPHNADVPQLPQPQRGLGFQIVRVNIQAHTSTDHIITIEKPEDSSSKSSVNGSSSESC